MKTRNFSLILLFSTLMSVTAQTSIKDFGFADSEELKMTSYESDKSADALVIFNVGKSSFINTGNNFDIIHERTTRIKVFNDAGIKYANIEIPYYQEGGIYERVFDIEAYTYNLENGRITKTPFNLSNTYDEKINEYWKVKKFALPDVKEGTVFEYRYKIQSQYKFNLRDWDFQMKIPVIYSEYEVRMIPFYEYSFILQGASKLDSQVSYVDNGLPQQFGSIKYNDYIHKYIMKNVPAFYDEEFISSINDYIIKIDFQLSKIIQPTGAKINIITTWPEMIKELNKHKDFGKYISRSQKLAPKVLDMPNINGKSEKEKFDIVINTVKSNFNWNKYRGKHASKTPDALIKDKVGSCADINLFAVGLLKAVGIDANPVIISTRENGSIKYDYPFSHFFNYVIIAAQIDGATLLSDATEILAANNRIPVRCFNDRGLFVVDGKVNWVALSFTLPSVTHDKYNFNISVDSLKIDVEKTGTEYEALRFRNNYSDNKNEIRKKLSGNGYNIPEESITVFNHIDADKPYILNYTVERKAEVINDKIYIAPFMDEIYADNPLKQNTRTYPIDMIYPFKKIFQSVIPIPEGYKAEFVPLSSKINTSLFELEYSSKVEDNKVVINFSWYFTKPIYAANEYSRIKAYFNEIVRKGHEKVVLSKI